MAVIAIIGIIPASGRFNARIALVAVNPSITGIIISISIAMTANDFAEDVQRCLDAGMNAHLAKPLDDKKIKQTISEELRKQNACHE